jgi:hypothetical protein
MAFKSNYGRQRADRNRSAAAGSEGKEQMSEMRNVQMLARISVVTHSQLALFAIVLAINLFCLAPKAGATALNCPQGGCGQLWKNVSTCTQAHWACMQECVGADRCPGACGKKLHMCKTNGGTWPGLNGRPGKAGLNPI